MKLTQFLSALTITTLAFAAGCTADANEREDPQNEEAAVVESVASPLLIGGGGGGGASGGLGWCGPQVDCENKCIRMYPGDASAQSLCKKIEKCGSKCSSTSIFQ